MAVVDRRGESRVRSVLGHLAGLLHAPREVRVSRDWVPVEASVTSTIEGFTNAVAAVPSVLRVVARSRGPHVDFIVVTDGPWHEAIDRIEPRLTALITEQRAAFDYTVLEATWREPIPAGYIDVHRAA